MIKVPYKPFDRFILRTPLKSIEFLQLFLSKKKVNIELLKNELQDPVLKEAIFLASPDLYYQLLEWLEGKDLKQKDVERLLYSVLKYLSRLSSRSTPFGLFAGISVGEVSEKTIVEVPDISRFKRNLRLDMNYTVALAIHLSTIPTIKKQLRFYPNSSIYVTGKQLRYVEYKYHNAKRIHHIAGVDDSEYLQKVLNKAKSGAYLKDLSNILVDDEINYQDAEGFINELITNQILVSELEPSVSGDDLLIQIIDVVDKLKNVEEIRKILHEIKGRIDSINLKPLGMDISKYIDLIDKVKELNVDFKLKYMFQVDLSKPTSGIQIEKEITKEILKAFNILNRITPKHRGTNLEKFKEAFYERYEEAEVPLLEALDTETGVGYINYNSGAGIPAPLIDDITFPGKSDGSTNITWDSYNSFILRKYIQAVKERKTEIVITDKEIEKINSDPDWNDLPVTISAMVQLFKKEGKNQIYLKTAGGSSAVNILGRFADCNKQVYKLIQEITSYEEKRESDKILAEIVHLPESRTGNVLLRPIIRKYEIPYLAKSNVKQEFQILPDDIMISVRRNQIILRSKKLNKQIVPHLSNAHNFSFNALPVYQFLCDMQTYNQRGAIGFNWGILQNEFDFLPRVSYKNIIFSFAEWNIKIHEIEHFININNEDVLYKEVQQWRNEINLPAWVSLVDGDNKLTLNLENKICIKTLISLVKKRSNFRLSEFYLNRKNAFIKHEKESYANEFIFAFKK